MFSHSSDLPIGEQIRQALQQARASGAKGVVVSGEWYKAAESLIKQLDKSGRLTALKIGFRVDPAMTERNQYRVE